MNSFLALKNQVAGKINVERFGLFLLFLFPIGLTYVRHWASEIFGLLFFVSVYYWVRYRSPCLVKEEKILLGLYLAYFLVFILTSLVNGWEREQTVWLGLELRFLGFIPIYFMLRQFSQAEDALFSGMKVGLVGVFVWGLYELYVMNSPRGIYGTYGPLFIGPVTGLFSILVITYGLYHSRTYKAYIFYIALLLAGLFVVMNTSARSSYLAVLISLAFLLIIMPNTKKKLLLLISLASIVFVSINFSSMVGKRSIKAFDEFVFYMKEPRPETSVVATTSVGARLEMMRTVRFFLMDSPIFGVGRGNYLKSIKKYVSQGKLNPSLINYSHPHNVFVETLASRGLLGLVVVVLLMYYPLWIFVKSFRQSSYTATIGTLHILMITIYSMTDASILIKGNYVALNLLFIALLFSTHLRKIGRING